MIEQWRRDDDGDTVVGLARLEAIPQFQVRLPLLPATGVIGGGRCDGSGDIGRMSGEIESLVGSMTGRLKALEDSWKGSASTSFQEVLLEWKDTARQVRESLDSIGQVLGQVGDQYAEVEDANTRSFGRGR